MSNENASNNSFSHAFLPGLILGLIVGAVAGAFLPDLLSGPKIPAATHSHAGAADGQPRDHREHEAQDPTLEDQAEGMIDDAQEAVEDQVEDLTGNESTQDPTEVPPTDG